MLAIAVETARKVESTRFHRTALSKKFYSQNLCVVRSKKRIFKNQKFSENIFWSLIFSQKLRSPESQPEFRIVETFGTKRKYYYTLKLAEANLVRSSNKCSKTFWHDPKESFLKARIVQLKLGESSGTHKNKQELINKLGKVIEKIKD